MKKFCDSLREHTKNIINFEKKKMSPLTKEELKSHQDAKVCCICRKKILEIFAEDINYRKARDYCHYASKYRGTAHSICNLKFDVPNEIPVVCHRSSNYDYHFIITELANEFVGQFDFLEKTKKSTNLFRFQYKRKIQKLIKMVMKRFKPYLTKQNLLIVQDLWQVHYKSC